MSPNKKELAIISFIGVAYLVYLVLRAWLLPITVDEGATCLSHVGRSVWDVLTYETEAVPNNHILNTLGIKFFSSFLGLGYFTARLPSLIGGVLYVLAATGLAVGIGRNSFERIAGMVLLLASPYVVEFFSLARGYGLATGLMLAAIYTAWRYMFTRGAGVLAASLCLGVLAVMANFTFLNFFVPFWGSLGIIWFSGERKNWVGVWPLLVFPLVLGAMAYLPITRMTATDQFRFWGTTGFYQETLVPLIRATFHGHRYLGKYTGDFFACLIIVLAVPGWIWAIARWKAAQWRVNEKDPFVWAAMLLFGTFLFNMLQAWFLHVPFLNSRTCLFYYPLFVFQLFTAVIVLEGSIQRIYKVFLGAFTIALLYNFLARANLFYTFDWSFDANTFRVLDYVREQYKTEGRTEPYTLDTHWLEENSFMFQVQPHHNNNFSQWVVMPPWHGDRPPAADSTDFYFTHLEEEVKQLTGSYTVVWTYSRELNWWLLRKNSKTD